MGKARLDDLLVARGLAESRDQAQRMILAGEVSVGDAVADKPGRLVADGIALQVRQGLPYVSRGGLQLQAALDAIAIAPTGWVCADVGASTGGFTDCLLKHGAALIYAIDVGYGQLAWSLRQDRRVVIMERTNVRFVGSLPEPVALVTVDVSFIGLKQVLPSVVRLLGPAGHVLALIKPQFEVAKGRVGKGGVVRDAALHREVIMRVLADAESCGLAPRGLVRSPITGPAGNAEFVVWLQVGGVAPAADAVQSWLSTAEVVATDPRL